MPEGNGADTTGVVQQVVEAAASAPHSLPTTFRIGGKDVRVPALTLSALEMLESEMALIDTGAKIREYTKAVLRVIATSIEVARAGEERDPEPAEIQTTYDKFRRRIIFGEMSNMAVQMNELLINTGYVLRGEAEAAKTEANPGTGTSTESPPNSPSGASAEAIPEESSVH
jgi:hypothetical protein